jgi:hypothetical protein
MQISKILLIGVSGKKYSGKDTIGDYLVKHHGFVKLSFAEPLKKACQDIFGFTDEQLYTNMKETIDPYWNETPRRVMQHVGTELLRESLSKYCPSIGNDIWIRALDRRIHTLRDQGYTRFVVTDVRYSNESDYITNHSGKMIHVVRPSFVSSMSTDHHASEIAVLYSDLQVINNGDYQSLYEQLNEFLDCYLS